MPWRSDAATIVLPSAPAGITLGIVLGIFAWCGVAMANDVSVLRSEVSDWHVATEHGPRTELSVGSHCIEVLTDNGKTRKMEVLTVFDPATHLYWWRSKGFRDLAGCPAPEELWNRHTMFVDDRGIVAVYRGRVPPALYVRESIRRFETSEQGHAEMLEFQKNHGHEHLSDPGDFHAIELLKHLDHHFFKDYGSGEEFPPATTVELFKIAEVAREASGWRIVLTSYDERPATLFLDSSFRVIRVVGPEDKQGAE